MHRKRPPPVAAFVSLPPAPERTSAGAPAGETAEPGDDAEESSAPVHGDGRWPVRPGSAMGTSARRPNTSGPTGAILRARPRRPRGASFGTVPATS